jgi:hypothetical protein
MNFQQAIEKIKENWVITRPSWACKVIRSWKDSDADFFATEFDNTNAIIQECNKPCDCKVGIWIPENGDKEADDWVTLYNHKSIKNEKNN